MLQFFGAWFPGLRRPLTLTRAPPSRGSYPTQRKIKEKDGHDKGVLGAVQLLQKQTFSTQPVSSFDWNADKEVRPCRLTAGGCSSALPGPEHTP